MATTTITVGNYSLTESDKGKLSFSGVHFTASEWSDISEILLTWKYGLVPGGGQPVSEWSAEKLSSARAFIAAHQK